MTQAWWEEQTSAAPAPAPAAEVDWLGEAVAEAPKGLIGQLTREQSAKAAAYRGPDLCGPTDGPKRVRAPKRDLIPFADAWTLFDVTTAPDDPDGPRDHVVDLRVVRGSELSERMRRRLASEAKDWTWDRPLYQSPVDDEDRARMIRLYGGDPEKEPQAAWRFFCSRWRFADPEQVYEAISQVEGLSWVIEQWKRGQG